MLWNYKTQFTTIILIISFFIIFAPPTSATVIVYDRITTVGTPVRLVFKTKGRFIAQGGKLVDIYLENKKLGRIMTGGDGYGFFKYTFRNPGYKQLSATSNGNRDSGLVLVMKKNEKAILIEVEGGFKTSFFSEKERDASRQALESIRKTYKIIYFYRFAGKDFTQNWLTENNFPQSVVLPWRGAEMLAAWKKRGVQIHAMVSSPALLAEAADYVSSRFSFEETKKGETVKDWSAIRDRLKGQSLNDPAAGAPDE
jgi:hypothetical protein